MSVAPRVNRSLSVITIPLKTYRHHQVGVSLLLLLLLGREWFYAVTVFCLGVSIEELGAELETCGANLPDCTIVCS